MHNFQVLYDGKTYLVENGNIAELQAEITEAVRAGGGFVTFLGTMDFDDDRPVRIFVTAEKPALIMPLDMD